jgi:heterodisulfide reductase subunit B
MIKIGYFPGCSLIGTSKEYDVSLKIVANEFDIELEEIDDWSCCGATAAHSISKKLAMALPARNLALAEKQGFDEILVPCAACYSRFLLAWHELKTDAELRAEISDIIEMPVECKSKPITTIDFIDKWILPGLKAKAEVPFDFITACYYGCLLVRPPELVQIDRYEDPLMMENIIKAIGGKPLNWAFKTECCGAGLSVTRTDLVGKLSGKIINDAVDRGGETIVVACPMCHSNLDMRRGEINKQLGKNIPIPVLFITEAIGLALGYSPQQLGINKHFVQVSEEFLSKLRKKQDELVSSGEKN